MAVDHTMVIASELQAARQVEEALLARVNEHGYNEAATFAIKLALEEGLNNAIKHGNGYDPAKQVRVEIDVDASRTVIVITDEGRGFKPEQVPDPTADENLERPCGRGLMLMRAYMDEVTHNERGNQVRMVKRNA
jgi:serine/threonine-protein kinase RsbW